MEKAPRHDDAKYLAAYYNNLGQADAKTGQLEESLKDYDMAAQLNPAGAAQYYYNRGAVLTNAGRNEEAIAAFGKSLAADPNKAEAYQQRAKLIAMATTARKTTPDANREAEAKELSGMVKVTSNPDGADLYCDGSFVGNTPSTLTLSAGKHTVEARSPNQKNWSREITVQSGSDVTLNAILQSEDRATRAATETPLASASHSSTSSANGPKAKDSDPSAVLTSPGAKGSMDDSSAEYREQFARDTPADLSQRFPGISVRIEGDVFVLHDPNGFKKLDRETLHSATYTSGLEKDLCGLGLKKIRFEKKKSSTENRPGNAQLPS